MKVAATFFGIMLVMLVTLHIGQTVYSEFGCHKLKCAAGKLVTLYGGQCACITEPK